jgi:hypothetical protein
MYLWRGKKTCKETQSIRELVPEPVEEAMAVSALINAQFMYTEAILPHRGTSFSPEPEITLSPLGLNIECG